MMAQLNKVSKLLQNENIDCSDCLAQKVNATKPKLRLTPKPR